MVKQAAFACLLSLCLAPFFLAGLAWSADVESESDFTDLSFDELMEVEITSVSKKQEKLSQAAAAVYVISQQAIRRSGATSIPEALRLVPGVDVAQIDPNKWAIGIRGFTDRFANKLLVLLDGRSVYSPSFSGVYWEYFDYPLEDIERIEVIRGPGATLWGANAVNGVINIITREAADGPGASADTRGQLAVGGGDSVSQLTQLRLGGQLFEQVNWRSYVKNRPVNPGVSPEGGTQENGGDNLLTGFRADWQTDNGHWLTLQGDLYRNRMDQEFAMPAMSAPFTPQITSSTTEAEGGNLMLRWEQLNGLDSELGMQVYFDFYRRSDVMGSERRQTVDLDFTHQLGLTPRQSLVWGGGARYSHSDDAPAELITRISSKPQQSWNLFAQYELQAARLDAAWILGNKLEGDLDGQLYWQPNLRWRWGLSERLNIWGAASRAVRTPGAIEQSMTMNMATFAPGALDSSMPLPALIQVRSDDSFGAETLDAFELGGRWRATPQLSVDLALFYNRYDDLRSTRLGETSVEIIDGTLFAVVPRLFTNSISGTTHGGELLANWQVDERLLMRLAYSYIDIDLADSLPGANSASLTGYTDKVPQQQISLWSQVDFNPQLELDLRLYFIDQRPWQNYGTDYTVPSRFDADARLGWQLLPQLSLAISGRNLLQHSHHEFVAETWPVRSQIERSFYLSGTLDW